METDPVIAEIREVRHQISTRFNHDPARLVAYYIGLQDQYRDRLLRESEAAHSSGSAGTIQETASGGL